MPYKTHQDAKASWAIWRGSCATRGDCTIPGDLEKQKEQGDPLANAFQRPAPKPTQPPAAPGPAPAPRAGVTPQARCSAKRSARPDPRGRGATAGTPPPAPGGHGSSGPGSPHKPPARAAAPCAGPPAPIFPASPPAASPPRRDRGLAHPPCRRPGPAPLRRCRSPAAPAALGSGGHRLPAGPGPPPLPRFPAQHGPAPPGRGGRQRRSSRPDALQRPPHSMARQAGPARGGRLSPLPPGFPSAREGPRALSGRRQGSGADKSQDIPSWEVPMRISQPSS